MPVIGDSAFASGTIKFKKTAMPSTSVAARRAVAAMAVTDWAVIDLNIVESPMPHAFGVTTLALGESSKPPRSRCENRL